MDYIGWAMRLTIDVQQMEAGIVTLKLVGVIDGRTYELLDREMGTVTEESIRVLVLDMTGVEFVTSAGIGTIIKAKVSLARKGAELTLTNLQPQVERVFEIIRLLPTFKVFRDRDELDEYLGRIQRRMTGHDDG
jgi:anti-anti-sigma factor